MRQLFFTFIIIAASTNVFSQNTNNFWCFGDSAGIDFNLSVPAPISTSLDTRGSCVSIADSVGNLLFYANTRATLSGNTTRVWNKDHDLMQNGDSLTGRGWYNELTLIPMPGSNTKYYLFSVGVTSIYGFYYSIIDMSLNGGLGAVIEKNTMIDSYKAWDAIGAVKHGNGRDWWMITKSHNNSQRSDSLNIYLITPDGIQGHVQQIGDSAYGGFANMIFNRDGSKFLFTAGTGLIEVMDFDRCTGLLSNANVIFPFNPHPVIRGSAFSPNGNVLYYATGDVKSYLIQLDLTAPNIWASRDTLARMDAPGDAAGSLRLAPDNKIYWSCAWTNGVVFNYPYQDTMYHPENMNLSVINDPDVVGSGCNVSMYSFYLGGKRTYWGLPNNPDYDLGPLSGSACDSLSNGINETERIITLNVYPNPATESVFISGIEEKIISVEALNSLSQIVSLKFEHESSRVKINTGTLISGIYLLKISTNKKQYTGKFVKQ
jgi:Secretion system C-terminal sorting domain